MLTRRQAVAASMASAVTVNTSFLSRAMAQVIGKQTHVIVGFAAGGGTDVGARLFAERIRGPYATQVIVENKVGAAARLAVEYVKNADADGSVILFTPDFPVTLYPHIFKSLPYDPVKDLTPVAPFTKSVLTFNIGTAVPASITTLPAFIDWCKANPDKANYATTGAGGTPHFVGVMFANAAGIPMTPVHYRGGAPALQDLIGGHVAASINPISEAMPLAQAGQIRTLAVASSERTRFLPNIPTMREQGLDVVINSWTGAFLPAKADPKVVAALSAVIAEAVKAPDVIEANAKLGNEMTYQPQPEFAATVKADIEKWGPIVKASGFVPEE